MQSPHQPATEPNRKRPARARQQHPARHLAFRKAAPQTSPAGLRMHCRTRALPAAGRLRGFGVAVMLAAPLFAGPASPIAASPAGNAPVASARNPAAPDTVVAATLARFPDAAPRRTARHPVSGPRTPPGDTRAPSSNGNCRPGHPSNTHSPAPAPAAARPTRTMRQKRASCARPVLHLVADSSGVPPRWSWRVEKEASS
jgi:hypothetical protein